MNDHDAGILLNLKVPPGSPSMNTFLWCAKSLAVAGEECGTDVAEIRKIRAEALSSAENCGAEAQMLRAAASILCDLRMQGWSFRVNRAGVWARQPVVQHTSPLEEKARVRAGLLLERDNQLRQEAVRHFIADMERRRFGPHGWTSIFSLMADGRVLAERLRAAAALPLGPERARALHNALHPYIQIVDDGVCPFTGLKLKDIWRYFRSTWVNPYQSTPGRNIWFLIRDRAAVNHPVVGIGALGSAVMQLRVRDEWIGWTGEQFIAQLRRSPTMEWASWVHTSLDELIAGVYLKDFLNEGIITTVEINTPTKTTIERLRQEAKDAWKRHRLYPKASQHKAAMSRPEEATWEQQAQTHLFRAKRAEFLASILDVRLKLSLAGFSSPSPERLAVALGQSRAAEAIQRILRYIKAAHAGVDMLDITVCGAIAPYHVLLGGKLVSLLLASPEVIDAYEHRYASSPSIIASSMAGRPIQRPPQLVLLGTTSLYGVGSSQYNRLRVPAEEVGGKPGLMIDFNPRGHTAGFGSCHFSRQTITEIDGLLAQSQPSTQPGRKVNSIFGEGVNPKLRKIRVALDMIGFPSDLLLKHGSPRLTYTVALASNFREVLLGMAEKAEYILPREHPEETTTKLVDFWIRRWLSKRIENQRVLNEVERHTLTYPIQHGARVFMPPEDDELQPALNFYSSDQTSR